MKFGTRMLCAKRMLVVSLAIATCVFAVTYAVEYSRVVAVMRQNEEAIKTGRILWHYCAPPPWAFATRNGLVALWAAPFVVLALHGARLFFKRVRDAGENAQASG